MNLSLMRTSLKVIYQKENINIWGKPIFPRDAGRKFNVCKMFRKSSERLCTFTLPPVSRGSTFAIKKDFLKRSTIHFKQTKLSDSPDLSFIFYLLFFMTMLRSLFFKVDNILYTSAK